MQVQLTEKDVTRLLTLIRQEARRSGYGNRFFEWDRSTWPHGLKRLRTIARKLSQAKEAHSGNQ